MPFQHLSDFLNALADRGKLVRVGVEVSATHELAAISDRVIRESGPAVLFENVAGKAFPAVTGLWGTEERLLQALGVESYDVIADRITSLIQPDLPAGWLEALHLIPRFAEVMQWPPRLTDTAMSQQVVHMGSDVDLGRLPAVKCWPGEEQFTLTAAQVYLEHSVPRNDSAAPGDGESAARTTLRTGDRMSVVINDDRSVLLRVTPHDEAWRIVEQARREGRQLPVAVALGGDPLLTLAADVPLPPFADPLVFAGFLRGEHVAVAKARSVDIHVPADADVVLEGLIDPSEPFRALPTVAAPTGFLGTKADGVLVQVTALTHRANPVVPVIIPGRPLSEDSVLAHAAERMLLPLARLGIPQLVDLRLPPAGAHRNIAFASVSKSYPQQARQVMNALWGMQRLSTVKLLVVVDAAIDVHNDEAVWFEVGANAHPGRDVIFSEGPADMFDHAAPVVGVGHRMGIDATRKLTSEGHTRPWPEPLAVDQQTAELVQRRWSEYGISLPGERG